MALVLFQDQLNQTLTHSLTLKELPTTAPIQLRERVNRASDTSPLVPVVTGCALWESGFLACDFIISHASLFAGKRVLELGVGSGLTTLIMSLLPVPPAVILATDADEVVLENLQFNLQQNSQLQHVNAAVDGKCKVIVDSMDWTSSAASRAMIRRFKPDIVLLCDTFYLKDLHDSLLILIREALSQSKPVSVLSFQKQRNQAFPLYKTAATRHLLTIHEVDMKTSPEPVADKDCKVCSVLSDPKLLPYSDIPCVIPAIMHQAMPYSRTDVHFHIITRAIEYFRKCGFCL